ncbi:MAG TPA: flagellar basal body P-ring formation chaperone FlgA [Alphaproteobacteria bacterium]|nr:flagellar basal body P-ring formation chaperone FlgA [Alphaproteobacteria bacterium]
MTRLPAALLALGIICSASLAGAAPNAAPLPVAAGAVLTSTDLAAAVERALAGHAEGGSLRVTLDNRGLSIPLDRPDAAVTLEDLDYSRAGRRFRANVAITVAGRLMQSFPIGGTATPMVAVPVLRSSLGADETIRPEHIAMVPMPANQVARDAVLDPAQLEGLSAKRMLAAEQPIRSRDVQAQVVVAKNSVVTLVLQTPAMTLTAKGRALDNGGVGQTVRVQNATSKRIVEGLVIGAGQVQVTTGSQQVQALN